ncbi:MAG: glycosyltransferase family 2 protein [Saprospirales bacterium]|nr:glycosyltransferase family 2 protein [Saprospirales bacterium]
MKISVVLCTYNPRLDYLQRVLDSLKNQTLTTEEWELIIVDNNSRPKIENLPINLDWHPNSRVVKEEKQGLIHARIKGTVSSKYNFIVTVDDDTILDTDYLEQAYLVFMAHPKMGIFGGRSKGEFEIPPPGWLKEFYTILCIKDLGAEPIISQFQGEGSISSFPPNGPFLIAYHKYVF